MEKGGAWGPIYPFHECNYTPWQKKDASGKAPRPSNLRFSYIKTVSPKNFGRFEKEVLRSCHMEAV
jgi:hypothetical protein